MSGPRSDRWAPAVAHLLAADPRWRPWLGRLGPCRLRPRRDRFGTLVRSIISQQISTKAARSIDARLRATHGDPHRPEILRAAPEDSLRAAGLSASKARSIRELAESVHLGRIPLARMGCWPDERIAESLLTVRGIGPWTAEMFLIFAMNRPDVLSATDYGIRAGLKRLYGLPEMPTPRQCAELTEPWRPYRSVGMWFLWRLMELPAAEFHAGTEQEGCST